MSAADEKTLVPLLSPTDAVVKLCTLHALVLGELSVGIDMKRDLDVLRFLARLALPGLDVEDVLRDAFELGRKRTVEATEGPGVLQ